MENNSRVCIVILNWNGIKDTIKCIKSLININYKEYEILVIDNGSKTNESQEIYKIFKEKIQIIRVNKNLGFAGGNNFAFKQIFKKKKKFNYILIINNDTIVEPNFLKVLIKETKKEKENIGISTPMICDLKEGQKTNRIPFLPFEESLSKKIYNKLTSKKIYDTSKFRNQTIKNASGCCMLFNIKALKEVGSFNEEFFAYVEDSELSYRFRKSGYKLLWVPKAKIWHEVSSSTGGYLSDISIFLQIRNHFLFFKTIKESNKKIENLIYTFVLSFYYFNYLIFNKRFNSTKFIFLAFFNPKKGFKLLIKN